MSTLLDLWAVLDCSLDPPLRLLWSCGLRRARWIASAIRLIRCSRASQADPTDVSWATARASWASSTR